MRLSKVVTFVIVAALITGTGAAIFFNRNNHNSPSNTDSFKPKADDQLPQAADKNTSAALPGPLVSSSKISISSPKKGEVLKSGNTISGTVQSADGKLYVVVKGSQSGTLTDYFVDVTASSSTNQAFSFEVALEKKPRSGETGYLELYTKSGGVKAATTDLEVVLQ